VHQPQPCGFFAAKPCTGFFISAEPLVKPWVLIADLRDVLLSVFKQKGAKPLFVQKGTLPVFLFDIVFPVSPGNMAADAAVGGHIVVICITVYLNVPPHTAAVIFTLTAKTSEIFKKDRAENLHNSNSLII
jgi:hypothetical protein